MHAPSKIFSACQTPNYQVSINSNVSLLQKLTEPFFFRLRKRTIFESFLDFSPNFQGMVDQYDYASQNGIINTDYFSAFNDKWSEYLQEVQKSIDLFPDKKQNIIKMTRPHWDIELQIKHADFGEETCELGTYGYENTLTDILTQLGSFAGIPVNQPIIIIANDEDDIIFGAERVEACHDFIRLTFMDFEAEMINDKDENYPLHTVQIEREWLINQLRPLGAFQLNINEWYQKFPLEI
ncbi:MAG: hypothetical protein RL571_260 [Pseudomonadota bacterium]|jgi:hypothetical protein